MLERLILVMLGALLGALGLIMWDTHRETTQIAKRPRRPRKLYLVKPERIEKGL